MTNKKLQEEIRTFASKLEGTEVYDFNEKSQNRKIANDSLLRVLGDEIFKLSPTHPSTYILSFVTFNVAGLSLESPNCYIKNSNYLVPLRIIILIYITIFHIENSFYSLVG